MTRTIINSEQYFNIIYGEVIRVDGGGKWRVVLIGNKVETTKEEGHKLFKMQLQLMCRSMKLKPITLYQNRCYERVVFFLLLGVIFPCTRKYKEYRGVTSTLPLDRHMVMRLDRKHGIAATHGFEYMLANCWHSLGVLYLRTLGPTSYFCCTETNKYIVYR